MIDSAAQGTRIKRGTTVTISNAWYADGTIIDPGVVTIGITRDDGTVLVAAGTATSGTGAAARTFTLTTTHTALVDLLTATWTSPTQGADESTVEIAGDFLFTIAQAKATSGLASKTAAQIVEKRTIVEDLLEQACGVAFVQRYGKVTVDGNGCRTLVLPPRVTAIRSVTVDDVLATDAATVRLLPSGVAYYPAGWTRGYSNITIAYEHGYSDGPERHLAGQAALTWARMLLIDGPIDDRYTSVSNDVGTFRLATPGHGGSVSGIPSVDVFIHSHDLNVAVA